MHLGALTTDAIPADGRAAATSARTSKQGSSTTTTEAPLALVVPQFFFPPTSLLGAIGFSATSELYFSYAILTTGVVVLNLYLYQYTRMMRGGPTI